MRAINPENRANREKLILDQAIDAFRGATGFRIVVEALETIHEGFHGPDALVRLTAPGIDRQFGVEIKKRLTPAALGLAVHQLERFPQQGMVITDYVTPNMAERLRAMNVPFLDAAGNAYINEPPLFVYIRGNKPAGYAERQAPTRAFHATGLKVLFALLRHPELAEAPYRNIAKAAKVALGTVGWVITDLKDLGFLVDLGKRGRRLANKAKLVERWVTAYPEQLRPKLLIGRYRAADPGWWMKAEIAKYQACWGGEVAAARLTQYLKPEQITIYTREKPAELLLVNRLKKDPDGDVEILEAFWQMEKDEFYPDLAPALLIYADLMATGEPRNVETARMIYEKELARLVRED